MIISRETCGFLYRINKQRENEWLEQRSKSNIFRIARKASQFITWLTHTWEVRNWNKDPIQIFPLKGGKDSEFDRWSMNTREFNSSSKIRFQYLAQFDQTTSTWLHNRRTHKNEIIQLRFFLNIVLNSAQDLQLITQSTNSQELNNSSKILFTYAAQCEEKIWRWLQNRGSRDKWIHRTKIELGYFSELEAKICSRTNA